MNIGKASNRLLKVSFMTERKSKLSFNSDGSS